MSSQVREIEAKLLLKKHDRRVRLLRDLCRGPAYFKLSQLISFVAITVLAVHWEQSTDSKGAGILLLFVAGIPMIMTGACFSILYGRIDTLIALLQQEGMLQSQFPASPLPEDKKATTKP